MPEANPAPAPHMGLIHAFGICVEDACNLRSIGESEGPAGEGMVLKLRNVDGSSWSAFAYWLGLVDRCTGGGGAGSRLKLMP